MRSASSIFRRVTVLGLSLLMSVAGLPGPASAAPDPGAARDGEAIFRGLLLGEGDVAKVFPEIWEHASLPASAEGLTLNNRLVEGLKARDPEFFARFAQAMQSGDHLQVEEGLVAAAHALRAQMSGDGGAELQGGGEWLYKYAYVFVAVVAVIFQLITQIDITPRPQGTSASGLQKDILVDLIATRLAPVESAAR